MTAPNNYTRRVSNINKTKKNKTQHNQCDSPPISSRTIKLLKHYWKQICEYKSTQYPQTKESEYNVPLTTEDIANICKTNMYSNIPKKIQTDFESTSQQGIKQIGIELPRGRKANIYIAVPTQEEEYQQDKKDQKHNQKMTTYMSNIIAWLHFVSEIASPNCAKTLNIYLLLGNAKKELPDIDNVPIDTIHANTAFTTSCSNSILTSKLLRRFSGESSNSYACTSVMSSLRNSPKHQLKMIRGH